MATRSGYLTKEPVNGRFYSNARERWFVLSASSIEWYVDDSLAVRRGGIALRGAAVERIGEELVVTSEQGERLVLRGDDIEDWESSIRTSLARTEDSPVPAAPAAAETVPLEPMVVISSAAGAAATGVVNVLETITGIDINGDGEIGGEVNDGLMERLGSLSPAGAKAGELAPPPPLLYDDASSSGGSPTASNPSTHGRSPPSKVSSPPVKGSSQQRPKGKSIGGSFSKAAWQRSGSKVRTATRVTAALVAAPSEAELEDLTLAEIASTRDALAVQTFAAGKPKTVLVRNASTGKLEQKTFIAHRAIGGAITSMDISRRYCVRRIRRTCLCRTLFASEPETPLTFLHLLQPIAFLLTVGGIALMVWTVLTFVRAQRQTSDTVSDEGEEAADDGESSFLAFAKGHPANVGVLAASIVLLFAGLRVRRVPTQEQLNVRLASLVDGVGASAGSREAEGDVAQHAAHLSLARLQKAGAKKDATAELREQLRCMNEERYRFELKRSLMRYLWQGEELVSRQQIASLERDASKRRKTVSQFRREKAQLLPDGALSVDDLEVIVEQISSTEKEGETVNGVLADALQALIDDIRTGGEGAPRASNRASAAWTHEEAAAGLARQPTPGKGTHSQRERDLYSYADIFTHVHRMAKDTRFKEHFDQILRVDAERSAERAAAERKQRGSSTSGGSSGRGGSVASSPGGSVYSSRGASVSSSRGGSVARASSPQTPLSDLELAAARALEGRV